MGDLSSNDQMLEMFLFEMSSLLDQLDEVLLTSEKNQTLNEDSVGEIFRIMHTIKGSSAMMEFNVISTVTHRLEDTFFYIRDNGIQPELFTELFDLMLDATDFLKSQLEAIQNGDTLAEGNDELVARAVDFLKKLQGDPDTEVQPAPASVPAETPPVEAPILTETLEHVAVTSDTLAPGDGEAYKVDVLFEEDCGMENLRAFMLINMLKSNCSILSMDPADIESDPDTASYILVNGFSLIVQTTMPYEELQATIDNAMHVKSAVITRLDEVPHGDYQVPSPEDGMDITGPRYEARIRFEEEIGMENLRAFMLVNTLRSSCKVVSFQPEDVESNPDSAGEIVQNGFTILLESPMSMADLQHLLENSMYVYSVSLSRLGGTAPQPSAPVKGEAITTDSPIPEPPKETVSVPEPQPVSAAPPKTEAPAAPKKPASNKPIKQNLINVSLSKLDELMDLMGELVITESMVIRSPDLRGLNHLDNFHKAARQLSKLTDELQDMVMSIRMVPVAGTFQKMQRVVRDMCRALGKDAELVTIGDETDIDKTIIDGIADPIMHLVRNSMDHGVELPEERIAAGKNPKATVTLSAQNTGGEILIAVADDGKGLDAEKLLSKAKSNGILTKPASEYTDKEAYMLLTAPGFSTKEAVTEFSGRGVGMDVVKKNIEKVGGSVVIESKKGYGMSVFLKIPLTLAIVDGMDISVGDGTYTLQITAINESFKATKDQVIVDTDGNEMIVLRGNVYPIIRLHELYNVPDAITDIEEGIIIWVQSGDRSACLFVDQLIGEQQIVVKPLPLYLNKFDIKPYGISGCTIQGDGNISLILDVGSIIEKVMEKR